MYKDRTAISPNAEEVLPKIKMPCLMFAGEQDPWFPVAKASAALIPDARFVALQGLDHGQVLQHTELVLPFVKEFLAGVAKKR